MLCSQMYFFSCIRSDFISRLIYSRNFALQCEARISLTQNNVENNVTKEEPNSWELMSYFCLLQ